MNAEITAEGAVAKAAAAASAVEANENALDVTCPNCGGQGMRLIYEMTGAPVHSVLLMQSREEAQIYPQGEIRLGYCDRCGFISNVSFQPELQEYSKKYESTQAYSPTFNTFHRNLAQRLIDRYDLRGKRVVEIGCGQGEFLVLLSELGDVEGVGVDPAYDGRVTEAADDPNLTFISDFYSEKYTDYTGDFICCKMTLEHIPDTADFVRTVRRSIGDRQDVTVFFQIPSATYVLRDLAFWDIYYEHCTYFTPASLRYLFEDCGFEVLGTATEYDDQYLMIECKPAAGEHSVTQSLHAELLEKSAHDVAYFEDNVMVKRSYWRKKLNDAWADGKRTVIWGSGSKGVAFLTTLQVSDAVGYAVDINPNKHGTFMPGTGHEIVGPDFLTDYRPDLVIVMNPIYAPEIQRDLDRLGVEAELVTV
ncbi:MAG: methyltransferase domain-containing protein [Caldilineaceae bacterium]|nr:methyltransferase domain-containing protein [Caldilineaceae bacterium]